MHDTYGRFSTARILEHWMQMLIFTILVATGLSQRFHTLELSLWIIMHLGGIDTVRFVHRCAALVFSLLVLIHIAAAVVGILYRGWRPSLVITGNDLRSAVRSVRYYLGMERYPAMGGKYTYTQKFEYWGIVTGALLMILTGFILWKPLFVTRFMTGQIIPAAKALHSNEAMVVFLIIAGWHVYNAVFSPDVFPLNPSIFTGSITRERMLHDHILELARIENRDPRELRAEMQEIATIDRSGGEP